MESEINSVQEKCANCGGNLYYNPSTKSLFCDNCKTSYPIKNTATIQYHNLNEQSKNQDNSEYQALNKVFKCPNCGANVVLSRLEISAKCPYCATGLVIDDKNIVGLKPDAVIPFEFDEAEAGRRFVGNIKKRFFAPNKFKKQLPENDIFGIYIPSFGFDADTFSVYSGQLYNEHTVTDGQGHTRTVRNYFKIAGNYDNDYHDIMVESSAHIYQSDLNGLLPYKYNQKQPYSNAYIMGYSVEQYDKTVDACKGEYRQILDGKIRQDILRKYSYSGVSYLNINTQYKNERYLYNILPLYRFEYKYKNKNYITYMNGQTGKVDGNTPKSGIKIAMVVILALLVVVGFIILGFVFGGE